MRLFRRQYRLQVDTLEIRELNVAFSIERTLRRTPGRCEIKAWNLSADHRRQLEALRPGHVFVEFHAGYEDGTTRLFRGELHRASTERSGPDIITTIRSRDGGGAHEARVSRSHAAGVSLSSVVRDLVGSMGIGEGNLGDHLETAALRGVATFHGGVVMRGSAPDELTRLLRPAGLEWSVQDGALQVLPRGRALTRAAIRLAPETGLLGSPTRDRDGKLTAIALLVPELTPGRLVQIDSDDTTGTFRVVKGVYKGELDGPDWSVEITCDDPSASTRRAAA